MSVQEIAVFHIAEGRVAEFEDAAKVFSPRFLDAGALSFELSRVVDRPGDMHLVIGWESVAAHTEEFTKTEAFADWVAAVTPLYASDPDVYHVEQVL